MCFAGKQSVHEKREALRFLHICLASVLNLRSPDDSELPGTSMDKLTSMLFGNQVHYPFTFLLSKRTVSLHCTDGSRMDDV